MNTGSEAAKNNNKHIDANEDNVINFQSLREKVGRFNLADRTFVMPEMGRITSCLLAAAFKSFGIKAYVMETFSGLTLGKEYTSGKECFPCQITLGDILYFINKEKEKLGDKFNPDNYYYFMPEAGGPCRFGMYNKYQRIILDSFTDLENLKIVSFSTADSYALDGVIDKDKQGDLRKVSYFSVLVGDILDRLLWRIRPYEKEPGMADQFIEEAMNKMADTFESLGGKKDFDRILDALEILIRQGKQIIDENIPSKPLIGVVGEIYLRSHTRSNQNLIRELEKHGAEVVNASLSEWINFITYERLLEAKRGFRSNLRQFKFNRLMALSGAVLKYKVELFYQEMKQKQVYKRIKSIIDIAGDHLVPDLDKCLKKKDIYSFDLGTEACLSIPGILEYANHGFNGIVNVYPFTCMPSTVTSAIIKPLMNKQRVPYLDTPYDETIQPGGETSIRTFMYQAEQHFNRHGRPEH